MASLAPKKPPAALQAAIGKAIAHSRLVKTALFASDPGLGFPNGFAFEPDGDLLDLGFDPAADCLRAVTTAKLVASWYAAVK